MSKSKLTRTNYKYFHGFKSRMEEHRYNGKFCDVDVHVDGRVFKCHRLVLSAASEYFEAMFNGDFQEGRAKEVFLRETDASAFEEIIRFVYRGEAVICRTHLYNIIRAADCYKLPLLVDLCKDFIVENMNAIAEDILKIFSYAYAAEIKELVVLLSRHIFNNFDNFSATADFVDLDVDALLRILEVQAEYPPGRVPLQDPFLKGIHTWMRHQMNLTSEEKRLYLNELVGKIDLTKLSERYIRYSSIGIMERLKSSIGIGKDVIASSSECFLRPSKLLRAYVSRTSDYGALIGTSIFAHTPTKWLYMGELELPADKMRTIVSNDDRSYSLSYSYQRSGVLNLNFTCSSSISNSYSSLSLPPCFYKHFDMCGMANEIYLYNQRPCTTLSYQNLNEVTSCRSNGMLYYYKRDIDKWFTLPHPKSEFIKACMACDEERVYLVGGTGSSHSVQAYDPRMQGWSVLPPTKHMYEGATCHAYDKKMYIIGGFNDSLRSEIYDLTSGNLVPATRFREAGLINHQLTNWPMGRLILYSEFVLKPGSKIWYLYTTSFHQRQRLRLLPDLYEAVSDCNLEFEVLDLVNVVSF